MSAIASDIARFIFIALGAVSIGCILPVLRLHCMAWRHTPGKGLLPAHVLAVAVSHILLLANAMLGSISNLRETGISWRIFLYVAACLLTIAAMALVGRFENRRIKNHQRGI